MTELFGSGAELHTFQSFGATQADAVVAAARRRTGMVDFRERMAEILGDRSRAVKRLCFGSVSAADDATPAHLLGTADGYEVDSRRNRGAVSVGPVPPQFVASGCRVLVAHDASGRTPDRHSRTG